MRSVSGRYVAYLWWTRGPREAECLRFQWETEESACAKICAFLELISFVAPKLAAAFEAGEDRQPLFPITFTRNWKGPFFPEAAKEGGGA